MRKRNVVIPLVVATCVLNLAALECEASNAEGAYRQDERSALGCGPAEQEKNEIVKHAKTDHPMPTPSSGKALVYIMWKGTIKALPTFRLGVNGNWVALVQDGTYSYVEVDPGVLSLCWSGVKTWDKVSRITQPGAGGLLRITAERDKTYYLEGGMQFGGNPLLFQIDEAAAKEILAKNQYATMKPKQN